MTMIRYVSRGEMTRRTGMSKALGYAFPQHDEILIRDDLPPDTERKVRSHEAEHIRKGEEGPFLGALIGAGASILGGILGSKSSSKGAKAQERAAQADIDYQRESRDLALEYNKPYRDASYRATAALMDMTGLARGAGSDAMVRSPLSASGVPQRLTSNAMRLAGSSDIARRPGAKGGGFRGRMFNEVGVPQASVVGAQDDEVPDLSDFNEYDFKTDPGYQFRLDEGMRALERSAAARGGLLSGGFARKALRYAQDYASNEYTNVFNRIATIAGFGQVATANSTGAIMDSAAYGGNALMAAGNARASGYIGQGNAWANAINEIAQIDWSNVFNGGGGYVPSGPGNPAVYG